MEFSNLAQAKAEDSAAVTNLTTANSTLTEQGTMYANRLSSKEADKMALQTDMKNLQRVINNLKAEVASLKKSVYSGTAGAANKDNGRMVTKWKIEGQSHHPTWWSTTYCWSHGVGGHPGTRGRATRQCRT